MEPSAIEINGGEEFGDEFYEKIEAPKFVDLRAPDPHCSENDDRYWFCMRVGCDQKHEEEMDHEAIYKNFVLRVMAARSPSVRLRKALHKKDQSTNVKSPRTVPAKSSRSRVSKLAMISSISQKMVDANVKTRAIATPNAKAKQSSAVAKALTTPRSKSRLSNPGFRSVRNPKPTTIAVPKNRLVAKALVFHSPKKTVKLKKSVELSKSMRTIREGMKKLEITNSKKPLPLDASRKQLRVREVKSRVYDALRSQNVKGQVSKSPGCLEKSREKKSKLCSVPVPHEGIDNDSSDMEIEEKSRAGSVDVCSTSDASKINTENGHETSMSTVRTSKQPLSEKKLEALSDASRSDLASQSNSEVTNSGDNDVPKFQATNGEISASKKESDHEEKIKSSSEEEVPTSMESDKKEIVLVADDKGNENEVTESDDKENVSLSDANRKLDLNTDHFGKKKILGRHGTYNSTQKMTKVIGKTHKDSATSAVTGTAQEVKYRKPKPTNPKPFRLRTDERGILKEANMERKLHHLEPIKAITTVSGLTGGNQQRKHQNASQKNKNCIGENHAQGGSEKDTATQKSGESLKRTKSPLMKQLASSSPRVGSGRKKMVSPAAPRQLGAVKEVLPAISEPNESGASPACRPQSQGRRPATTPKEPHFHRVHVPKSCTRRVA